jgi:hypothetical protein
MIVPEGARNIEFLGHTDQGGRGDGVQVMVARGHAYIGTRVRRGVMVTDVRDPRNPKPVNFLAMHPNSVSMHLQAADDMLLCIQEADQRALLTQQEYYGGSNKVDSSRFGKRGEDYAAGMRVYDIKDPANPRHIGSMEVPGLGLHRPNRRKSVGGGFPVNTQMAARCPRGRTASRCIMRSLSMTSPMAPGATAASPSSM